MLKLNRIWKRDGMIELRYIKPKMRGSFPILAIWWKPWGIHLVMWPFVMTFERIKPIKSAPLTPEEKAAILD